GGAMLQKSGGQKIDGKKADGAGQKADGSGQAPNTETSSPPAADTSTPPTPGPAPKPWRVRVEQIKVDGARLAFTDESVDPAVKLSPVLGGELGVEDVP